MKSKILEVYEPESPEYINDETLPYGVKLVVEREKKGYKAAVFREVFDMGGNLVESEEISRDTYMPVRGKIKVNQSYSTAGGSPSPVWNPFSGQADFPDNPKH